MLSVLRLGVPASIILDLARKEKTRFLYCYERDLQARSRGRGRGARTLPEIFRFGLNSATKVEFFSLKWTDVNESFSFQVLSIIVRLCTVVLQFGIV